MKLVCGTNIVKTKSQLTYTTHKLLNVSTNNLHAHTEFIVYIIVCNIHVTKQTLFS